MIRSLRRRHRVMTGALSLAVVGCVVALASRPTDAVMERLPPPLAEGIDASVRQPLIAGDDLWEGARMETTVFPDQVVISPIEPLRKPDSLLYWAPVPGQGTSLPTEALLLGAITEAADQRLSVPRTVPMHSGHLLIYSLGHSEVFATLSLTPEGSR